MVWWEFALVILIPTAIIYMAVVSAVEGFFLIQPRFKAWCRWLGEERKEGGT